MKITTIGLDLAKNVFRVHGVNERGVAVRARVAGERGHARSPGQLDAGNRDVL